MKRLYAPWRSDYVTRVADKSGNKNMKEKECVFCVQVQAQQDDKYFILKRFDHCFVMMNFYPYNVGHLMILPFEHKGELYELEQFVRTEMMEALNLAIQVIGQVLKPEGFNIGINLGVAGGGGIPSHVHIHVLPRWKGDTNFLETLGETKLLSTDFVKVFQDLKNGFAKVCVCKEDLL